MRSIISCFDSLCHYCLLVQSFFVIIVNDCNFLTHMTHSHLCVIYARFMVSYFYSIYVCQQLFYHILWLSTCFLCRFPPSIFFHMIKCAKLLVNSEKGKFCIMSDSSERKIGKVSKDVSKSPKHWSSIGKNMKNMNPYIVQVVMNLQAAV